MVKAGRPKQQFTDEQIAEVEELAFKGCRNRTIALIVGCDDDTLKKYLSPQLDKKRAERRVWLREVQNKRAEEDKTGAVVIFLGKNELDQADKREIEHSGAIGLTFSPEQLALGKQMAEKLANDG